MEPFVRNAKDEQVERFELAPWLDLIPGISVGFTGRSGGVSEPPYDRSNLAYHVGDDPLHVLENRRRLAEALGFSPEAWTCGEQVHSNAVAVVHAGDRGKGYLDRSSAFQETDGLVTNVPGILLTSFYADCVPLYFADPVRGVVGLAHAGWKGTVRHIAVEMIQTMEREFGSQRSEIRTAIGPSIGGCCYEVDEAVMGKVREALPNEGGLAEENLYTSASDHAGKTMLNLKELNRIIMIKAGILPTHIECTTWCTSCHPEYFYSYRAQGGVTGRMASWIGIKER
ncbi:MAG: peptidoglycan editing factor PgeF [Paenibacillaceae bacterium]|uniref:Purine nucleoside phosphorylase n=1 Tax=Paenibacillus mellifer TaxID=2937794 RepID=A0A9X2BTD4_9BACL|nr:peptidoglycan editing factor PgeF [Paenibacillus mellifer]MBW4837951.1 peptidoglycan editing factor PgeF [Paenibacillaceae bacterium]MCK8487821.1 peptidoglycan editing factor PgeF [Paenibacillus mellifer]